MYEVQVVRHRGAPGTRGGLEALCRRFVMIVTDRYLKLGVASSSSSSTTVLSISHTRIKSVRVRGRLLRVTVDNNNALTVRLRDQEETLRAAEAMMDTWEIDPLVEDSGIPSVQSEVQVDSDMAVLVRQYLTDSNFRHLVHEIHDHIDAALAADAVSFEAQV
ncbi:unnamed protein product [Peronospora farinosa]|uniref:Uncharacterized protein n=1 Tax=Peronospora farinosa TaxID=134698 RepID=A0AAV0SSV5_9STRA|nr:unnamed protein product [Peronospora farinosa]CAI5707040.1 unnamed protein product [Peronospora farinosa]